MELCYAANYLDMPPLASPIRVPTEPATMPQSLAQIYLHIVFSTKQRHPYFVDDVIRTRMHEFLGGTCNTLECPVIKVGGATDHVHVLCHLGALSGYRRLFKS